MRKPRKAYAIRNKFGSILEKTIRHNKKTCLEDFESLINGTTLPGAPTWAELQNRGCRCVRVEIRELRDWE